MAESVCVNADKYVVWLNYIPRVFIVVMIVLVRKKKLFHIG